MAYVPRTTPRTQSLVARPQHGDLSGVLDDIIDGVKSAGKGALDFYNSAQQAKGAAGAYQSMTPATPAPSGGGISTQTVVLLGVGAVGLYFLLKK